MDFAWANLPSDHLVVIASHASATTGGDVSAYANSRKIAGEGRNASAKSMVADPLAIVDGGAGHCRNGRPGP